VLDSGNSPGDTRLAAGSTGNKEGYPIQERRKGDIALPMEARIKQPKNISQGDLSIWTDELEKMVPEERKSKSVGEERRRQSGSSSGPRTF